MSRNPVERNFVTRLVLGLAVLPCCRWPVGPSRARSFTVAGPVAGFVGMLPGALVAVVLFARWYAGYDASFDPGSE